MTDLSAMTVTVRVRKRWWARLFLFLAPRPISLLFRLNHRAGLHVLDWTTEHLGGPRALIIDVIDGRNPEPTSTR